MSEELQIRVYGDDALPTLVYLPGLHGDWTLVTSFRIALAGRVRFVEITYPRSLTWTMEDYVNAIEEGLLSRGINQGCLIGESFGSQFAWELIARDQPVKNVQPNRPGEAAFQSGRIGSGGRICEASLEVGAGTFAVDW